MHELVDQIGRLRNQLDLLERTLGAQSPAERLPWLQLDAQGRVTEVSPAAAGQLGMGVDDLDGAPLGALTDVSGDPRTDPLLQVAVGGERVLALRVPTGADGDALLVLGAAVAEAGDEGRNGRRRLVHDLANILGVMRGHAELLALDAKDAALSESLSEIVAAADRGQELLEQARVED